MTKSSINRLLIKFRDTGTVSTLTGSSGPWSARTEDNNDPVNYVVL